MDNHRLIEAMHDYWGKRCPDHDDNCAKCQAWAEYDALIKAAKGRDIDTVVAYDCGIRAGQEDERKAVVKWLLEEEKDYPAGEYSVFVAMVRRELEAGEHRK